MELVTGGWLFETDPTGETRVLESLKVSWAEEGRPYAYKVRKPSLFLNPITNPDPNPDPNNLGK